MNAPSQLIQLPLRVGLDEGVDPVLAPPGTLTIVKNGVWNKVGRLEKRDGSIPQSMATIDESAAPGTLQKLWARGGELAATDGDALFSRTALGWKKVGRIGALEAVWETATDTTRSIDRADLDATANFVAMAWGSGSLVYIQVKDLDGSVVVAPKLLGAITGDFRIFVDATTGVATLFYISGANVVAMTVSPTGVIATTQVVAAASFEVIRHANAFLLLYWTAANNIRVATVSTAFVLGSFVEVAAQTSVTRLTAVSTASEAIYLAWARTLDLKIYVAVHNVGTLAQTVAATAVHTVGVGEFVIALDVARSDSTNCMLAWTEGNGTILHTTSMTVSNAGATFAGSQRKTHWATLASKLFKIGTRTYAMLATVRPPILIAGAAVTQNTAYAVEVETSSNDTTTNVPHRLAAVIAPREAAQNVTLMSKVPVVNGVAHAFVACATEPAANASVSSSNSLRIAKLEAHRRDPWRSAALAQTLVMAGAVVSTYDGRAPFEIGFIQGPRVITATPGVGGSMVAGAYLYSFVYEWVDGTGLLHRSQPSQPLSVTVGANGSVAFVIECASTSGHENLDVDFTSDNALPVRIVPYRSTVGSSSLYRMAFGTTNLIANDSLSASVAWSDNSADASIFQTGTVLSTRPLLYTTGGVLDEVIPPGFVTLIQHRGRLWGVSGDRKTIWFSKSFAEDPGVFPGFNELLRIVLDDKIIALESLDDKLVIFAARSIFVVYGDGPATTGQGSDLTAPSLVHGNMPCLSALAVVAFTAGVIFQSAGGLYLLTRQLELVWIGRPVKDRIEEFPTARCAVLVAHKSQVRIALKSTGGSGVVLVFDYANGIWSTFVYPSADVASIALVGQSVYFTAAAVVMLESSSTCLDGGVWATLDFEVPFATSGPIAWQHVRRVKLLGERQTHHDLRLRLAFDHQAGYAQDFTFPAEMVVTNNDSPTVRVGSQNGANPKCTRLRVRVTDATPTAPGTYPVTTGKGGWFSAIGLELILKPSVARHGARHSKV